MTRLALATAAMGAQPTHIDADGAAWRISGAHAHGARLLAAAAIDRLTQAGIEYSTLTGPIPTANDVACWLSVDVAAEVR